LTLAVPGLVLAMLLSSSGCTGRRGPPTGEVAGRVTFEGKPVGDGLVFFMNSDAGAGDEAALNKDGTFAIKTPLPVGEYKVSVFPRVERKQVERRGPEVGVERQAVDIPQRYRTIGTTDLKATVKEGKNEINLEMKR